MDMATNSENRKERVVYDVPVIDPIPVEDLKAELTPEKKLRDTNKAGNEIYILTAKDSPQVMQEIGRLREISFRDGGGASGLASDIDEFDTMDVPYKQLIVWDPDAEAILGGYRYIMGPDIRLDESGQPILATSHMFRFSEKFIKEYLPYTIELGRSFVAPQYQSSKAGRKGLFALDNLWDGLAALMIMSPSMRYYFGKMTMYPDFPREARDLIHHFLFKHFPDPDKLVTPYEPLVLETPAEKMDAILTEEDFKSDYKILNREVRAAGVNIPPLVNSYMNISPTMKMFGGALNHEFSEVEETGIMITFDEMYEDKKDRHVDSFIAARAKKIKERFPDIAGSVEEMMAKRRERVRIRQERRMMRKVARRARRKLDQ